MKLLPCLLTATLAGTQAERNVFVDEALGHESNIEYYDNNTRYPHQMDEYDAALNLFIDVTPVKNSTRNHNVRTANSCSADGSSCLSGNHCCQGGCSTSGTCICQAQNDWCFNYGGPDSYCCSNVCGVNGRCKCIQKGKSCAVGGEHCCSGLVCDEHSLICTENASQSSGKPSAKPTQAPKSNTLTGRPTPIETNGRPTVACIDISVEIKTDRFGSDTSWNLAKLNGKKIANVLKGTYGQHTYDRVDLCLKPGKYNFTITDEYRDGICCAYGNGFVKISIDGREVLHFKSFSQQVSELLNIGFDPSSYMNRRERQYLNEHNKRRKVWHESNNVTYVPLVWSPELAKMSKAYAVKLLDACNTRGIKHEDGVEFGENLAKNKGRNGWGQLYPVKNIVRRWVDREEDLSYPSNGHLTQALVIGINKLMVKDIDLNSATSN